MNYALGHAFNLSEIFENFKIKKLKMKCKDSQRICGDLHREHLAQQIFADSLRLVLEDIIENNVTFILPTGRKKSSLHAEKVSGEDFKRARRFGKFKEIDFLKTFFSGFRIVFEMNSGNRNRKKEVYVEKELKQKFIDNINAGKQYY